MVTGQDRLQTSARWPKLRGLASSRLSTPDPCERNEVIEVQPARHANLAGRASKLRACGLFAYLVGNAPCARDIQACPQSIRESTGRPNNVQARSKARDYPLCHFDFTKSCWTCLGVVLAAFFQLGRKFNKILLTARN